MRSIAVGLAVSLLNLLGSGAPLAAEPVSEAAQLLEAWGTIAFYDAQRSRLTLEPVSKHAPAPSPREFSVDSSTVISKAGVSLQAADLAASGEEVAVQYLISEGQPTARAIVFEEPDGLRQASGTIAAINLVKGEIVLKPKGLFSMGQRQAFAIDESTIIAKQGVRSYLMHLLVGDEVLVGYTMPQGNAVAYLIEVQSPPGRPQPEEKRASPDAPRAAPSRPEETPQRSNP